MSTPAPVARRRLLTGAATLFAAAILGREARASGMQLFVRTLAGATIGLQVHAGDTIDMLHLALAARIRGYDRSTTAIQHGGVTLQRGTLRDCGIPAHATLQLARSSRA